MENLECFVRKMNFTSMNLLRDDPVSLFWIVYFPRVKNKNPALTIDKNMLVRYLVHTNFSETSGLDKPYSSVTLAGADV